MGRPQGRDPITISSGASWLTTHVASGSNNFIVIASASANTGTTQRSGTITVAGGGLKRYVVVTQETASQTPSYLTLTLNGPTTVPIANGARIEARFTAASAGTYTFRLQNPSSANIAPMPYTSPSGSMAYPNEGNDRSVYLFTRPLMAGETFTFHAGVANNAQVTGSYQITVTR